jgi:hypothetical protein
VVNSFNKKAMKIDLWLGFEEILRVYGAHDEGGDIVLLQMTPAKCRWLKEKDYGKARAAGS